MNCKYPTMFGQQVAKNEPTLLNHSGIKEMSEEKEEEESFKNFKNRLIAQKWPSKINC